MAEWLGRGLQNLVQRFESASDLTGPDGEMVDALVSGASVERRVGSSPILGTSGYRKMTAFFMPRIGLANRWRSSNILSCECSTLYKVLRIRPSVSKLPTA